MEKIKKYLTQRNRNILAIITIILGTIFLIYYSFYTPSYINEYIATNIYKAPANSYFDDENFYNCVIDAYNEENKTSLPYTQSLTDTQLKSIKELSCSSSKEVSSAKGLEKITALTSLELHAHYSNPLYSDRGLKELDISKNTALTYLVLWGGEGLTELDISKNTALTRLELWKGRLTEIDVSKNTALTSLTVFGNQLTEIDVSKNTALTGLNVFGNQLTEIDVSKNTALTGLNVSSNQLTEIDVSKNTALTSLTVSNNQLTEIDVSKNTNLRSFEASNNNLTEIDVSKNTWLDSLKVNGNNLTEIDASKITYLRTFEASNNNLTEIDVSKNTNLRSFEASNNNLTEIDVSKNTWLISFEASNNNLTKLDISKNIALTDLDVSNNKLTQLDLSKHTALTDLNVSNNELTKLDISKNIALIHLNVSSSNNLFTRYYTLLDKQFTLDNRIILPNGWTTSLNTNNTGTLNVNGNKITPITTGQGEVLQSIYNEKNELIRKKWDDNLGTNYICTIYVYNITSDTYIIDKDNIYINFDTDSEKILSNINFDYGDVNGYTNYIENNKLIIKHNDKVIKEYNLIKLEVTSDNYVIEDNIIKYIDEFDINNVNINYGTKEIIDNKLVIKYNDKIIKEYNLVKLEVTSNKYNIYSDYILHINELDTNKININYGTKEIIDNKLVIKYKDKVLKEYKLLRINSEYSFDKDTIYIGQDLTQANDELLSCYQSCGNTPNQTECADNCDLLYGNKEMVKDKIKSDNDNVILSVKDNSKLVVKYNGKVIKEYNLSDKEEYLEINDYNRNDDNLIISKIPVNTDIDTFKTKIDTNFVYEFRDISNNVITDRNLRTGDKIMFNNGVEYILSLIGDSNGDGKVDVKDIRKIANFIVGNETLEPVYEISADVDSSTNVDIKDIRKIAKYIVNGSEL